MIRRVGLMIFFLMGVNACGQQDATQQKSPVEQVEQPAPSVEEFTIPSDMATEVTPKNVATTTDEIEKSEMAPASTEPVMTAMVDAKDQRTTGLDLAGKSGCLACHKVDKKLVGPAWMDVAKRYKDQPGAREKLINKIKKGGKGQWTEITGGATMPPYSPRVSDDNIGQLVDFVLSL